MKRIITVLGVAALMAVMLVAMAAPAMAKKKPASAPQGHLTALTTQSTNPTLRDAGGFDSVTDQYLENYLEDCYQDTGDNTDCFEGYLEECYEYTGDNEACVNDIEKLLDRQVS
jgi:hypothetical protein